jgi:hypothetical protein
MPEPYRALVFLLLIGLAAHGLSGRLRAEELPGARALRRHLWFALTVAAFLLGDFWLFSVVAFAVLVWAGGRERNLPALFLALLFVVPPAQKEIPAFGFVNFLFGLSFPRLMALVLLLPMFLRLLHRPRPPQGGWARLADLLFFAYVSVQVLLLGREPSVTSALRSAFYVFVDLVLPYYVFSRSFDDLVKIRDAMAALVTAGLVLAAVGVFEATRHWLLYAALTDAWGSQDKLLYLGRSGVLRAMGSTGHAIALGYVLTICLLLYLPIRTRLRAGWPGPAMLLLLAAGLISPLSRGPWLGAAAGILLYLALGARPMKNLVLLGIAGLFALGILPFLPLGGGLLELVPFFGSIESGNFDYRQRLMENAAQLVWRDPLLGSSDYTERLAEMGMVQGQGIVDLVNTYVQVVLRSGLVGLALFVGVMAAAFFAALRARKLSLRADGRDAADIGRALAAAQLAVIVIIGSVSSILVIPWVYWCLAGLLVAYARVVHAAIREPGRATDRLRLA